MSNNATSNGTCQACGRLHAIYASGVRAGKIATHGYAVRWNQFVGTCVGSRALPFEVSKDLVEGFIATADAEALRLRTRATEAREAREPRAVWVHRYVRGVDRRGSHQWQQAALTTEDRGSYLSFFLTFTDGVRVNAGHNGHLDYRTNTVEDACAELNGKRADAYVKEAAYQEQYATWQRERIANWAPQPLPLRDGK
jgi:hypothetical protein